MGLIVLNYVTVNALPKTHVRYFLRTTFVRFNSTVLRSFCLMLIMLVVRPMVEQAEVLAHSAREEA